MKNGGAARLQKRGRVVVIASALMMTTALAPVVLFAPEAKAQVSASGINAEHAFDIPAQPLTSALAQFGVQAGVQVTVDGALARGIDAPTINGTMRASTALEALLRGSGLDYDVTSDGTVVIEAVTSSAGEEVLETLRVEANAAEAYDPADAVTDSFVAPRSLTASKTDTPVLDDPASISVITQKEMETRKVQDLQQAVSYTAGVAVDDYGSDDRYDFIRIRSFALNSLGGYRDGLAERIYGWTTSRSEPYGLQQIDVLKGSTSSLFGLNGPGGLINGITKRPEDDARGEVFTTFGENHLTTGGDVTGPVAEDSNWTYRLTALWQDAERGQDYSRDDRLYIAPAFTYKPKAGTEFTILTDYSERDSSLGYGFPRGVDVDPDTFLGEPDFNSFATAQFDAGYLLSHQFADKWTVRQNARYTHVELDNKQVYGAAVNPATDRTAWTVDGALDRFSIDNQLQYDTSWDQFDSKTLMGIDFTDDRNRETVRTGTADGIDIFNPVYCGLSCINLNKLYRDWDVNQKSYGVYGQEQLTIDEKWIVTLGGRFDYVETETEYLDTGLVENDEADAFTTRAGLTYKVTDDFSVYGNYSESFQPLYAATANGLNSVTGELKPQEGTQYEVGMKYVPADYDAIFTAALFDLAQTNVPYNISPTVKSQVGEIRTRGLELEGKMSLTDHINMTVAYTFMDSEIVDDGNGADEGNRPSLTPEHMASAWLDYTIPQSGWRGDLTFGGGVRFNGQTYGDNANQVNVPSYTVFDAAINYAVTDNVDLAINATNLFDREYRTTSYFGTDYYGDGRKVLATLKYSW